MRHQCHACAGFFMRVIDYPPSQPVHLCESPMNSLHRSTLPFIVAAAAAMHGDVLVNTDVKSSRPRMKGYSELRARGYTPKKDRNRKGKSR